MAKVGRKKKKNPDIRKVLLEHLRIGHTDIDACSLAGISQSSFYEWIQEDAEFSESVTQARLRAKDTCIKVIRKQALTDATWAAWWLTRKGGKEFKADSELPPINVTIDNQALTPELETTLNQAIKYALPKNLHASGKPGGVAKKNR